MKCTGISNDQSEMFQIFGFHKQKVCEINRVFHYLVSYSMVIDEMIRSLACFIKFYTITWLLCAFSLVIDCDLLIDHRKYHSMYWTTIIFLFLIQAVTSSVIYYSTHMEKYNLFVKWTHLVWSLMSIQNFKNLELCIFLALPTAHVSP